MSLTKKQLALLIALRYLFDAQTRCEIVEIMGGIKGLVKLGLVKEIREEISSFDVTFELTPVGKDFSDSYSAEELREIWVQDLPFLIVPAFVVHKANLAELPIYLSSTDSYIRDIAKRRFEMLTEGNV